MKIFEAPGTRHRVSGSAGGGFGRGSRVAGGMIAMVAVVVGMHGRRMYVRKVLCGNDVLLTRSSPVGEKLMSYAKESNRVCNSRL